MTVLAIVAAAFMLQASADSRDSVNVKTVTTLYGPTEVISLDPKDPITARLDSNITVRIVGPLGQKVDAHDLPIIGKKFVGDKRLWVVQFGAKNAYAVLADDSGDIFALDPKSGQLAPDDRIKPRDAKITPLPR